MTSKPSNLPTIRQLGGEILDLRRLVYENDKTWSATNPSIGYHPKKGFAVSIRSSNYVIAPNGTYTVTNGGQIKSQVWFSELDKNFKCKDLRKIDVSQVGISLDRGLEDPKLFWRDNSWHFTCVMLEKEHTEVARMAVAKLDPKCTKVVSLQKLSGVDPLRPEKNWMTPYEHNQNFDFIYGPTGIVKDSKVITDMKESPLLTQLRGSTNLWDLGDGTYLSVMHRTYFKKEAVWVPTTFGMQNATLRDYHHFFVRFDKYGTPVSVSNPFQFHKPGVEFAAGIVVKDKKVYVSFGREDVSSHIAILPLDTVLKSLQDVE
jgi:hypothetical protein